MVGLGSVLLTILADLLVVAVFLSALALIVFLAVALMMPNDSR